MHMGKINSDRETRNVHNAICHYTLFNIPELDDETFKRLLDSIDLSNLTDREFFSNERIRRFADYEKIPKKQLIRLITRDPEIINKVNIAKFRFKIKELQYFLKLYPEYITLFNLDLKRVDGDEFIILMDVDVNYVNEIDFEKITFTKYQLSELLKKFHHRPAIIDKILNSERLSSDLDNYQIRQLIRNSGDRYIRKLDLVKLNDLDWFELLSHNPELAEYCDTEVFERNDCYMLVRLVRYIPALHTLVESNKDKISNIGWEKLLHYDFERYYPLCCFECLDYKTRKMFLHKLEAR